MSSYCASYFEGWRARQHRRAREKAAAHRVEVLRTQGPGILLAGVAGIMAGAAFSYLWDRDRGRRRRLEIRDRLQSYTRRRFAGAERAARRVAWRAYGAVQGAVHLQPPDNPAPDDMTLKHRVESEVFRNHPAVRSSVNVEVYQGTVTLRGQLPNRKAINDLADLVAVVPGVNGIHSLLHTPDSIAPNKQYIASVS